MSRLHAITRMLFLVAALLAVDASIIIFFSFGGTQVTETSDGIVVERQLSWFESQGWWGVAILFIFPVLYYGPLRFFDRGRFAMVYLFGVTNLGVTILALLSIGLLFLPSGFLVLLGLILLSVELLSTPKKERLSVLFFSSCVYAGTLPQKIVGALF